MNAASETGSGILLPALIAVGGSLIAAPASAMELAEITVQSTLGQPLRASIAYALGPNEAINSSCVTLQSGAPSSSLPSVSRASIIVADGVITVIGRSAVREPMMTININIHCPYAARLNREYTLFIDPAGTIPQAVATPVVAAPAAPVVAPVVAPVAAPVAAKEVSGPAAIPATKTVRRRPVSNSPIIDVARYEVQPGDSLSVIAQRIDNRPLGLWPTADAIFDANPDAFIDGDPNKIKAGSWLNLPDFAVPEARPVAEVVVEIREPAIITVAPEAYAPPEFQPLQDPVILIADTVLEGPVASSTSPNVPVATIRPVAPPAQSSTNWLAWLVGSGIAIIAGLLFFGRFGNRFGSTPIGAVATPQRRRTPGDVEVVDVIGDVETDDDSPTAENLLLDVDLQIGAGLQENDDANVVHDFGFAKTITLDIELSEEMVEEMLSGPLSSETDIIPPLNIDEESILMSEELPEEDDDYDMSVMIDATKMPRPEDVTERDLEAVQVEVDDGTLISGDYTISQEADYQIVEQDYEDELTATQSINKEIAKAAAALVDRMVESDDDKTSELPLASVTELDITAQLPAHEDELIGDQDDTGINPTINIAADN